MEKLMMTPIEEISNLMDLINRSATIRVTEVPKYYIPSGQSLHIESSIIHSSSLNSMAMVVVAKGEVFDVTELERQSEVDWKPLSDLELTRLYPFDKSLISPSNLLFKECYRQCNVVIFSNSLQGENIFVPFTLNSGYFEIGFMEFKLILEVNAVKIRQFTIF
jgi:hypothetical protein